MKKVEFLLMQLEGFLYLSYPYILNFFNDLPEDASEIADEDLKLIYNWRNGSKINSVVNIGKYQFCNFGYFLPYDEAVKYQESFIEEKYFNNKNYFPFMASLGGDFLLIDKTKKKSKVFLYSPNLLVNEPIVTYDSIENFIETIYECFNKGAYKYDKETYLEIDDELERKLTLKLNRNSKFWSN
jgi:hypothetical protein